MTSSNPSIVSKTLNKLSLEHKKFANQKSNIYKIVKLSCPRVGIEFRANHAKKCLKNEQQNYERVSACWFCVSFLSIEHKHPLKS